METANVEVISREEVKELELDITNIQAQGKALQVSNQDEYQRGVELLSWIQKSIKKAEEKRKFFVSPLNDHVARINAFFKNFTQPLAEMREVIEPKMMAWRRAEDARIAAEEERIRKEQAAVQKKLEKEAKKNGGAVPEPLPVPTFMPQAKTVFADNGMATVKKNWTWKIKNRELIPNEYWILDEKKLNAAVRAGIRNIRGIEIYQEESLSVRGV